MTERMDRFLGLLVLWLQLDCELEGSRNGQRTGRPRDISHQGKERKTKWYLHRFLGAAVESEKVNLKLVSKE